MASSLNRRGFTLLELMVVVAVVGVLASVAIPSFKRAQCRARQREAPLLLKAAMTVALTAFPFAVTGQCVVGRDGSGTPTTFTNTGNACDQLETAGVDVNTMRNARHYQYVFNIYETTRVHLWAHDPFHRVSPDPAVTLGYMYGDTWNGGVDATYGNMGVAPMYDSCAQN